MISKKFFKMRKNIRDIVYFYYNDGIPIDDDDYNLKIIITLTIYMD